MPKMKAETARRKAANIAERNPCPYAWPHASEQAARDAVGCADTFVRKTLVQHGDSRRCRHRCRGAVKGLRR